MPQLQCRNDLAIASASTTGLATTEKIVDDVSGPEDFALDAVQVGSLLECVGESMEEFKTLLEADDDVAFADMEAVFELVDGKFGESGRVDASFHR